MNFNRFSKKLILVSAGVIVCLALEPVYVSASTILPSAGVASLLETSLSEAEYIKIAEEAKGALWGYTNIGICNVESGNLNVRAVPSTDGKLVGKMRKDAACEVLAMEGDWAHIKSGEVEGYVNLEFLLTGPEARIKAAELVHTVAVAETDGLNVRAEANTNSAIVTQILKGEELEYVETIEGWVKVSIDGEEAYVAEEYVTVQETLGTAITMTELLYGEGVSDIRVEVVEYAKQFLGNPYVWGGTNLRTGVDCSGFVYSVYKNFGITLNRSSYQMVNNGVEVSKSNLQAGDLVFFNSGGNSRISHVGIYCGDGTYVHSTDGKGNGVTVTNLNSGYSANTYVTARRVLR